MSARTVVLTHHTDSSTTRVEEAGRPTVTVPEPDQFAGVLRAGLLYAMNGYDVSIRRTHGA